VAHLASLQAVQSPAATDSGNLVAEVPRNQEEGTLAVLHIQPGKAEVFAAAQMEAGEEGGFAAAVVAEEHFDSCHLGGRQSPRA